MRLDSAHLALVAEVYLEAVEAGDPPTQAVAETFAVAHSTATKWVAKARADGLLGPVPQGVSLHWVGQRCPTCGASRGDAQRSAARQEANCYLTR